MPGSSGLCRSGSYSGGETDGIQSAADGGVRNIGHLAVLPRENLKRRWGGINGEVLWLNAHGIDYSRIQTSPAEEQKGGWATP